MKTKIKPFIGKWSIVEMEAWDQEYVNMEVPGHFTFAKDGTGDFQFGLVQGGMDCRVETVDGRERIEFSWDGTRRVGSREWARMGSDRKRRAAGPNFLSYGRRFRV